MNTRRLRLWCTREKKPVCSQTSAPRNHGLDAARACPRGLDSIIPEISSSSVRPVPWLVVVRLGCASARQATAPRYPREIGEMRACLMRAHSLDGRQTEILTTLEGAWQFLAETDEINWHEEIEIAGTGCQDLSKMCVIMSLHAWVPMAIKTSAERELVLIAIATLWRWDYAITPDARDIFRALVLPHLPQSRSGFSV